MATVQGWHIVSGDWRALDDEGRRRFWPLVSDRIRVALGFEFAAAQVGIDALELPFYRGQRPDESGEPVEGGEFVYELVQVGLPVDIDFVGLKRWCFFLWDGEEDLVALDGLSSTTHELNARIGIDLGERGSAVGRERAAMYLEYFCAFMVEEINKEEGASPFERYLSPFPLMSGPASRAWVPEARRAIAKAAVGGFPEILIERSVSASLDEVASAGDAAGDTAGDAKRVFVSAPLTDSARALVCLYGPSLHRAQLELVFANQQGGKWRNGLVRMIDDSDETFVDRLPPLFVKSWHRRIAFFCAREGSPLPDEVRIRPATFASLARSPGFLPAATGAPIAFEELLADLGEADRSAASGLLRLMASRHWGGPLGESRIRIAGDLELASPGEEVATVIDLDAPIHVDGHLVFAGAAFRSPVNLANWQVGGRVDGSGAHALRSLTLAHFRVENGIGRVAPERPGRREYPDNAIKLDELRVEGSLDLKHLEVRGALALRGAQVGGRLLLQNARLDRHLLGEKPGGMTAAHVVVRGSLEMSGLQASGPALLTNARVGGSADFSGAHIVRPFEIDLRSATIEGDLILNRYRRVLDDEPVRQAGDLSPTFVGNGVYAENVKVGGSVYACLCHVLGNLDFRGASIAHNLTIYGMHGAPQLPIAARATIVTGEISAYGATIGGCINIDGTVCRQLEFNFVSAAALFVYPASGSGLPLVVVGDPGSAAQPCMHMSHARIGGVFADGLRLGGGLRAINLRIDGDCRMNPAGGIPEAFAADVSCGERLLAFAWRLGGLAAAAASRAEEARDARQRVLRAFEEEVGSEAIEGAVVVLPMTIDGDLRLDGLHCGGNLETKSLGAGHVQLDGARIANKFLMADEASVGAVTQQSSLPRARFRGGLRLRNAEIGGTACLDRIDVVGRIEIRDSELAGGMSAVGCVFEPSGSAASPAAAARAPGLWINNVRTRSDLRLGALVARECEISESAIGGDLDFGCDAEGAQCSSPSAAKSQARTRLEALRIVSNTIEGGIVLDRLEVGRRIDLTDTRASRGLCVGEREEADGGVACSGLDLTRFRTDADVDLRHLGFLAVDSAVGASAACGRESAAGAGRAWDARWFRRYRDDLLLDEEAPLKLSSANRPQLLARHATIGGEFRLPDRKHVLQSADLAFASADRLEVVGDAFIEGGEQGVALVLRGARFDSARLKQPLPRRVDLREAAVAHWDIEPASGQSAVSSRTYLDFVHRSWPYTQSAYTKLEQDYRDGGQHKDADHFLAAAGWRTWRWSMIRPAFEGWGVRLWLALAAAIALMAGLRFGAGWGVTTLVLVGTLYGFLSPIEVFKRASRSLIGLFIVAPFQLLYGFGIRWWLPLVLSAVLLVTVTVPTLSDCRNLQGSDGGAAARGVQVAERGAAPGGAKGGSLLETLGAETSVGPAVVSACTFESGLAAGNASGTVQWDLGEALWLALRYHVPVVPLDTFFHGERSEKVRPSTGPMYLEWVWIGGKRFEAKTDRISPIAYARTIYLLSWLVIPFSLIFAAARIQRKFRLQKD